MSFEISAGLVIFRREQGSIEYLLLQYDEKYWGFAKGRVEKGESFSETAMRELEEETGIKKLKLIKKLGIIN